VVDKLHFANGVVLVDNERALLIAETPDYQVTKYYLEGPKKGQREKWLDRLPGMVDNIHKGSNGIIRLSLPQKNDFLNQKIVQPNVILKSLIMKIFKIKQFVPLAKYAMVLEVDEKTGKIVRALEDSKGKTVFSVTSAVEKDGYLYLGTINSHKLARYKL